MKRQAPGLRPQASGEEGFWLLPEAHAPRPEAFFHG
jgi:hypothetical protein